MSSAASSADITARFGEGARGLPAMSSILKGKQRAPGDWVLRVLATASAASILIMLVVLLVVLIRAALPSFRTFGPKFMTTSAWRPNELERTKRDASGKIVRDADGEPVIEIVPPSFGALPVIYGTAVSSALALLFAVPLSFGAALFLVRIAPGWLVNPVSFLIEFLAAIPSIAYGLWGLFILAPFLQNRIEPPIN